jgi:hypothetical protein
MKKSIISLFAFIAIAAIVSAEPYDAASRERSRVRIDTNATTTVTLYTPTGAGQLLIGKTGGSNRVWIATDGTTNGWVQIAP